MSKSTPDLPPWWDRFWAKVDASGDCWTWTAAQSGGYGSIGIDGHKKAHRVAWETLVGSIPDGLEIDHLCRNMLCVNPDHLEPVPHRVNVRRGVTGQYLARRSHCSSGHPYTPENTRRRPDGARLCRQCMRGYEAAYRQRKARS